MNLISDEQGVAFGLFLFLAIVLMGVMAYAVINPMYEATEETFGGEYSDTYLTPEGKQTVDFLGTMFTSGLAIFVLIAGTIMVLNRAIYRGE